MENLSISEHGHGAQDSPGPLAGPDSVNRPPSIQQPQQLPAQMFTTAAQLLDLTDKKLMVALRDGRKLIGVLRSWDQFANLVLQSTVERIFARPRSGAHNEPTAPTDGRGLYADIPRGIFLVRGENVLLLGEIDLDKDDDPPPGYDKGDVELVQTLAKSRRKESKVKEKDRLKKLGSLGFEGENMGEVLL